MAAIGVTLESDAFEGKTTSVKIPMASLPQRKDAGGRVFASFIPLPNKEDNSEAPKGVSSKPMSFDGGLMSVQFWHGISSR